MDIIKLHSRKELQDLIEYHNLNSKEVVLDLETSGKNPLVDKIIDGQISGKYRGEVCIFNGWDVSCLKSLKPRVIGHNLKFDITFLYYHNVDVLDWKYHDTMLLGHLLDENRESYSLGNYVKELYKDNYKEDFWSHNTSYESAGIAARHEYGAKDIYYTHTLYDHLIEGLSKERIPDSLIEHQHRLQYALLYTEIYGVRVDKEYLVKLGIEIKTQLSLLEPAMKESAAQEIDLIESEDWLKEIEKRKSPKGRSNVKRPEFSFGSSKQLQKLIYDKLGAPPQFNEKTKARSVDYDCLEKIKDHHPMISMLQEFREKEKAYNTYIEGTSNRLREDRIYPEFRLVDKNSGMKTSRISHKNPNLGQLPKKGGLKGIYIPDDGELFTEYDYSQLEVCIEAHYTQDKNLLSIVRDGASKHDITAKGLGISRDVAKTLNFAMQYWCGPGKVSKILGCSDKEGLLAYNKYWETYSGVKQFKAKIDASVNSGTPLRDLTGRARRFEKKGRWEGDKAYRQAYNFVIQSTGGQIMNNSFYKCHERLRSLGRGRGMWTVHDSGLFSIKAASVEEESSFIAKTMVEEGQLVGLIVPLSVQGAIGMSRWGEK